MSIGSRTCEGASVRRSVKRVVVCAVVPEVSAPHLWYVRRRQFHSQQLLAVEVRKPAVHPHVRGAIAQAAEALGHRRVEQPSDNVLCEVADRAREVEGTLENELVTAETRGKGEVRRRKLEPPSSTFEWGGG